MHGPKVLESGEWQFNEKMTDYRSEWPGDMLVERATWQEMAPVQYIRVQGSLATTIATPGSIWFRFWLPDDDQVVERYFESTGTPIGTYIPICMPLERQNRNYVTTDLIMGLWLAKDGRVTVLYEDEFDQAVATGAVTPVEAERAEQRIRALTTTVAQKQFPPALVRNFSINLK